MYNINMLYLLRRVSAFVRHHQVVYTNILRVYLRLQNGPLLLPNLRQTNSFQVLLCLGCYFKNATAAACQ